MKSYNSNKMLIQLRIISLDGMSMSVERKKRIFKIFFEWSPEGNIGGRLRMT